MNMTTKGRRAAPTLLIALLSVGGDVPGAWVYVRNLVAAQQLGGDFEDVSARCGLFHSQHGKG